MFPTITIFGPISFSTFGIMLALGFIISAFLIWRKARDKGIEDEKILDNIIVVSSLVLVGARVGSVVSHWSLFSPNILRVFLVWKFPGLSFWGALIFGLVTFILYTKKQKLPLSYLFDVYAQALVWMLLCLSLGIFLDGSLVGTMTHLPIGLPAVGLSGRRHPLGLYAVGISILSMVIMFVLRKLFKNKYPEGLLGWVILSLLGLLQLVLAMFTENLLYWRGFGIVQILATGLLIGPCGPIFILLNGKKTLNKFKEKVKERYFK